MADFDDSDTEAGQKKEETDPNVKLDRQAIMEHGRRLVAIEQRVDELHQLVHVLIKKETP